MKYGWLILSLYMLLLAALPCADDDTNTLPEPVTIGAVTNAENKVPGEHTEQCTPFCICACCHVPVNALHASTLPGNFLPEAIKHTTIYRSSFYPSVYFDFWQPPKQRDIV